MAGGERHRERPVTLRAPGDELILADAISPCVDATAVIKAGRANRRDWLLVPGSAMRPECDPELQPISPMLEREDRAD